MSVVQIYTDGACRGNPGPGGWGVLMLSQGQERELCGGEPQTTNNRMELQAVIEALAALTRPCEVELHTDSQYVQKGIQEWIHAWRQNGWRTSARQPVKNADLWQRLWDESQRHQVQWRWVKGHAGNPGNERADQLARRGMEKCL
ncbi:MAG: ribonuclease HI [Ferrovum sp.]|nr:ribonuclease HI [Ferrovum sp.]NDU88114.1 ribonuclease HI [Ferrovum sp.]